ncbi:MAG: methionyl-tRNA synthetase [Parcubacteria group bacterium Athens0714_26]|nr:MAG: methionyl-tRNA synthetase [Parcubacteria group bacterium Athens1014_26]TSD03735.1 MAG: methionyl-tRNA synthetase [Parcubacteria group bacterium Athens0714_26]
MDRYQKKEKGIGFVGDCRLRFKQKRGFVKDNKFYITTSIAYVNAPPHVGFALESLQADVVARFYRDKGQDVFFLTGTDEHGTKIARSAENEGKKTKEFVDEISPRFKNLKDILNLSWDNFIRTSDKEIHWPVAQEVWNSIMKSGDLYKKTYKGLYCVGHESFVTRKDLVDGVCSLHKRRPEEIEEENWFFKLSKYGDEIKKRIKSDELLIVPKSRKNEALAFLDEGLEDISFSRPSKTLIWGIPVPNDSSQTMYVWADALVNYISGYGGINEWQGHPADVHCIGKDILRFHAVIWPAMLLSAGLTLPKSVFVHGFITANGEKMSKSLGNIIDPYELVKKYGTDPVRYYLLREIPSSEDGDFSYSKFEERYNGDLANGLGNFAARVLTLGNNYIAIYNSQFNKEIQVDKFINEKIEDIKINVSKKIEEFKFNEALGSIWDLIHFGDQYINEKKPWEQKDEKIVMIKGKTIYELIVILENVATLLLPFMPETASKILKAIKHEDPGISIDKIDNLFPRL